MRIVCGAFFSRVDDVAETAGSAIFESDSPYGPPRDDKGSQIIFFVFGSMKMGVRFKRDS